MLYLLGVVFVASRRARGPSVAASVLSIALFDFFFVLPYYTFSVSDARYVLTFGVMLLVALVMGDLTGRVRGQAEAARERERYTATLYALQQGACSGADAGRSGPGHPAAPPRPLRRRRSPCCSRKPAAC